MSWGPEPPAAQPAPTGPSNDWERVGVRAVKQRNRRILVAVVGGCCLTLVVLLVIAPTVASGFVRGTIESAANDSVAGRVEVDRVSLSWFGPQRVEDIRLFAPSGDEVARVDVESDAGLIGLALGGRDLGEVRLSGAAELVRDERGVTTLDRALIGDRAEPSASRAPSRSPSRGGGPLFTVPEGLAADVVIEGVTVIIRDDAIAAASDGRIRAVGVRDVRGSGRIEAGGPLEADLTARLAVAGAGVSGLTPRGGLSIELSLDGFIDARGRAGLGGSSLRFRVTSDGAGTDALAALAGPPAAGLFRESGLLEDAIGRGVTIEVTGDGPVTAMTVRAEARADHVRLLAPELRLGTDEVRAIQPVTVTGDLDRLAALLPDRGASIRGAAGSGVRAEALPAVSVQVSELDWRMPLRGPDAISRLAARASVSLGQFAASLESPSGERRLRVPESVIRVATDPSVGQGITLDWSAPFEIDGRPAGSIRADLTSRGLTDAQGGFDVARAIASVQGELAIESLPTAVAGSLAGALGAGFEGVDWPQALGPTLRVDLRARPDVGGSRFELDIVGEHVDALLSARSSGAELIGAPDGDRPALRIDLRRPARLMALGLDRSGLEDSRVALASPLVIDLDGFRVIPAGEPGEPAGVEARGRFRVDQVNAFVRGTPTAWREASGTFAWNDGSLSFDGSTQVGASGSSLGTLRATGVRVDLAEGEFAVTGEASLEAVPMAMVEVFAGGALDLPRVVGGAIEGTVAARPEGQASAVSVDLGAELADIAADVRVRPGPEGLEISAADRGVRLTHRDPRVLAERFAAIEPELLRLEPGGTVTVASTDARFVPAGDGASIFDRLRGEWVVSASGVTAGTPAGVATVRDFEVTASLGGEGVGIVGRTSIERDGRSFSADANGTVTGFTGDGPPSIVGVAAFERVPTDLIAALLPGSGSSRDGSMGGSMGGEERARVLADAIGPEVTLGVDLPAAGPLGAQRAVVRVESRGMNGEVSGDLIGGVLDGAISVRRPEADLAVTLAPGLVEGVIGAFALDTALPRIAERGDLRLDADTREDGGLDIVVESDRLALTNIPGMPDPAGVVGLRAVRAQLSGDLMGLLFGGGRGARMMEFSGRSDLLDADGRAAGTVRLALSGIAGPRGPQGTWTTGATLADVSGAWLDRAMGAGGRASGVVGRTLGLDIDGTADWERGALVAGRFSAEVSGEMLEAPRPLEFELSQGALRSTSPWAVRSRMSPDALNGWVTDAEGERTVDVVSVRPVRVSLDEFVFPFGEDTRPAAVRGGDGIAVRVRGSVGTPEVSVRPVATEGGPEPELVSYANAIARLELRSAGGGDVALQASVTADQTRPTSRERAIAITLEGDGLRGPDGAIDPALGTYSSDIRLGGFPTALADALGGLDRWLADLAGDTLTIQGRLLDVSATGGRVSFGVVGDFAEMTYSGTVGEADGETVLTSQDSPRVVLHTISDRASLRIREATRMFERLEKHRALDAHAELIASELRVPLFSGLESLQATVQTSLGDLRYTLAPRLDRIVRDDRPPSTAGMTDLRSERFRPFEARFGNGVLVVNGANFPLGGELITAMMRADLNDQTEQATLLIPARIARVGAFDQDVLGRAISAGGSIRIDREGPLGQAQWGTPELIFDPGRVLERAVEEGLRELLRRGIGG